MLLFCSFSNLLTHLGLGGPEFEPGSGQVGFVVDEVAPGQVFSEYFGFPCQSSFHQLLHNHPHLSSGVCKIGQRWPQYQGLSPTPTNKKKYPLGLESCSLIFKVTGRFGDEGCVRTDNTALQLNNNCMYFVHTN
jgi:hypothetical protein